ncbi:conserved hypothetical protein [Rippkaea orientalis PCC 8801]|uniref:ATPase AAA-type core domain-containing protein n=1 Tax=Rippkaea orientalis (strain PCC 8801 / RF-1) TaxID=41431 RepID=B7JWW7_RIPO1|nr:ATP-binding protein [Rippkaea orientalis]ACK65816.1 conserved hypothetical protein [Rippkaea orientalis PCC 8801]
MMNTPPDSNTQTQDLDQGITSISVKGFKSLYEECTLEIKPLTILAGANSSGKSSIMQPLLLMKQTLESPYDPGALLINGSHVKFTTSQQLLSSIPGKPEVNDLELKIEIDKSNYIKNTFTKKSTGGFEITKVSSKRKEIKVTYYPNMRKQDIIDFLGSNNKDLEDVLKNPNHPISEHLNYSTAYNKCFLDLLIKSKMEVPPNSNSLLNYAIFDSKPRTQAIIQEIYQIIHLPGLRGTPERSYPITAIGDTFQGTFDNYVASVIHEWQHNNDSRINQLSNYLTNLGLTSQVAATRTNDVQVEIQVGKLTNNIDNRHLINIADVGLGVSQVLPVIVALLVAKPGQLVYIEQPEIHLHPRAQANLAPILVDAANRGVKVVVETHSDLLLTRIQTLVAEGLISEDKVNLNWFKLREDGITEMYSTQLDQTGSYGDWPVDFSEITLAEDDRYLTAAESHLWKNN